MINRCEAYIPKGGLRCERGAMYIYCTRYICKQCAKQLILGGANPAPIKIKRKKSVA